MDTEPRIQIEFAWKVHAHVTDYIRLADSKAALVDRHRVRLIGGLYAADCPRAVCENRATDVGSRRRRGRRRHSACSRARLYWRFLAISPSSVDRQEDGFRLLEWDRRVRASGAVRDRVRAAIRGGAVSIT